MKNIKWLFAVCLMVVSVCFSWSGVRAEEAEIDTSVFKYQENWDGTITITDYTGTDETVIIPSEIDGKSVISIGNSSFYKCETIKHLIIQKGITKINDSVFVWCKNLEEVILPEGMTYIGLGAFSGCESLINIDIPDSVETIDMDAFWGCTKLSNIKLPNKLRVIEMSLFSKCRSLKTVKIPNSVVRIKSCAFAGCNNLNFIEIPEGVTDIEEGVFYGCESLTKIIISNTVNFIRNNVFEYCIEKVEGFMTTNKVLENVVIYADPNSYARKYANQKGIKFSCLNVHDWDKGTITVEPTIKNEGQTTYTCTACGIKKIETLPIVVTPKKGKTISAINSQDVYKVTKSGIKNGTVEFARTNDITMTDLSIPDTIIISGITYKVTSVAKNAFKNNKNLKKITIGKNVTKINAGAFSGCKNLSVINIKSKKISSVGKNAFKGIKAKAKIKVPSDRLSKYKKIFTGKGQKSTVKIKK